MAEILKLHPSGRIKLLDSPVALPGKCAICGSIGGDGREFIDFGFELDYYGVIYFCSFCFSETAGSLGYIPPSAWKISEEEITEATNKVSKLEAENVKLRVALNSLDFLGSHVFDSLDDSPSEQPNEGQKPANTESVKQIDESGSSDIPKAGDNKQSDPTEFNEFTDFI